MISSLQSHQILQYVHHLVVRKDALKAHKTNVAMQNVLADAQKQIPLSIAMLVNTIEMGLMVNV